MFQVSLSYPDNIVNIDWINTQEPQWGKPDVLCEAGWSLDFVLFIHVLWGKYIYIYIYIYNGCKDMSGFSFFFFLPRLDLTVIII